MSQMCLGESSWNIDSVIVWVWIDGSKWQNNFREWIGCDHNKMNNINQCHGPNKMEDKNVARIVQIIVNGEKGRINQWLVCQVIDAS